MVGVWELLLFVQLKANSPSFGVMMHDIGAYGTIEQCQEASEKIIPIVKSLTNAKVVSVCMEVGR